MALHTIRRGLDLPIAGAPEQRVEPAPQVSRVALLAADYVGLAPTLHVRPGDGVQRGQLLFEDKKTPGVRYTAPGEGRVVAVHRGERRALQSVVLELAPADRGGRGASVRFQSFSGKHPAGLSREQVRDLLVESGEWAALRQRPFSHVPPVDAEPQALFVTVTDSEPLAPDPGVVLAGRQGDFERGLTALAKLTSGPTYVCKPPGVALELPSLPDLRVEEFVGPHPAGTAGLHIHRLRPAARDRRVWWIPYQEVLAVGHLFEAGTLDLERVVSLAGPSVRRPRLLRARRGASLDELVAGELVEGEHRVVSGSVLCGREARGEILGYLGRRHVQISVLPEGRSRSLLGWMSLGFGTFSVSRTFASRLLPRRRYPMTTNTNGSDRAIVPLGLYERVFPWDIPAPFLLRALAMQDVEQAERLGALELDEEDLATCSYVCPGKHDYGLYLRRLLTTIEKEG